jgi:hypothetical protein
MVKILLFLGYVFAAATGFMSNEPLGTLQSCAEQRSSFNLNNVVLTPYPVQIGRQLVVTARGNLSKRIAKGAQVQVVGKLGILRIIDRKLDLCEEGAKVGKPCPVESGSVDLQVVQDIPKEAPQTTLNLEIKATNADGTPILCIRGDIQLRKP